MLRIAKLEVIPKPPENAILGTGNANTEDFGIGSNKQRANSAGFAGRYVLRCQPKRRKE
jgi:hypothetical protein